MKTSYYVEWKIGENWFSTRYTNKREAKKSYRESMKQKDVNIVRFRGNGWITALHKRSAITGEWRNTLDLCILLKTPNIWG